jgi:hypothetical protein
MGIQNLLDKFFSYKDTGKMPEELEALEALLNGTIDDLEADTLAADELEIGTTLVVDGATGEVTIDVASEAFTITGLPTVDPEIAGRLWNNSGVLTISAGA